LITDYPKFFIGFFLFTLGHTFAWFQLNSQFVWEWWQNKPVHATLIFSIPIGFSFWYGVNYMYQAMNELWGPRLVAFGASYLVFPLLTWLLAGETMFTPKTLICIFLSIMIVMVQLFWN